MGRFAGSHVLITGAGSGIGRATAQRLAAEGAALTLVGRRASALAETAALLGAAPVCLAAADITSEASIRAAVAAGVAAHGPLFAVVANAGQGGPNTPGPDDRFFSLVEANLTGTYRTLRAAEPHLRPGPSPRHLVVVASILARFGVPGYTGYCAAKAGLLGLVRALALELAPARVQVNALCPGWVDTAMAWEGIDGMAAGMGIAREDAHRRAMEAVPLGQMARPETIAGTIAWLLSPDAQGTTGQGIDVNGGAWMG